MEEDTVLFVTDQRVEVAIRVWAFRLKCKVGRFSRPVNRCSRLHKLAPEILHDVDHFLTIGNHAPLDVKGHRGAHGSDGGNAEGGLPWALGEIVEETSRLHRLHLPQATNGRPLRKGD